MLFHSNKDHKNETRTLRLIDDQAPFNYVEAYKSLRTNIDFLSSTNDYRSILITSSGPWDGKSTVSINLAVSVANSGKRVILVDCDLRKASIASYLKISRTVPGITSILSGSKTVPEVIIHNKKLNIDVLPVGALPPNPAELVGSDKMIALFRLLSELYDYVFIDTPPVSFVTDAAVMSRYVDGVLLVVRADETTKQALNASKKNLQDVNANILGVVLNDYDMRAHAYGNYSYRYSYRYKGYGYGYGGYDKRPKRKKKARGEEEE